jgi:hypothetical protein
VSSAYELHGVVAAPEVLAPIVERFPHARLSLLAGAELARRGRRSYPAGAR